MRVNEIFGPTIQGEGKSVGRPVMFLRLAGCNLACIWCDTPWSWNYEGTPFLHPEKYDRLSQVHEMSCEDIMNRLRQVESQHIKSLVISGGEPMLQQRELIVLLRMLKGDNYWVEIETNGTIEPSDEFISLIDQINCSPKTSNSGPDNTFKLRDRYALSRLASSDKTNFKFVIKGWKDLAEIDYLVSGFDMRNVYLMAEGSTRDEQNKLAEEVVSICRENNYHYSPRLHVLLWNRKRGV